jgi:hypothetical protein
MGFLSNLARGEIGFGNRKRIEYNATVKSILEDYFEIDTDSDRNPKFFGILSFLRLIDEGWFAKLNAHEIAGSIFLSYYEGLLQKHKDECKDQLRRLNTRMIAYAKMRSDDGSIMPKRATFLLSTVERLNREHGVV